MGVVSVPELEEEIGTGSEVADRLVSAWEATAPEEDPPGDIIIVTESCCSSLVVG